MFFWELTSVGFPWIKHNILDTEGLGPGDTWGYLVCSPVICIRTWGMWPVRSRKKKYWRSLLFACQYIISDRLPYKFTSCIDSNSEARELRYGDSFANFCLSFVIFLILMTKDRRTLHFNDESQKKVTNSIMFISVCLSEFRIHK